MRSTSTASVPSKRQIIRQLARTVTAQKPRRLVETGQVQDFRPIGPVKHGKDVFDPVEHVCRDLRSVVSLVQSFQSAMPEAFDHVTMWLVAYRMSIPLSEKLNSA
jgi:hypothetical protein